MPLICSDCPSPISSQSKGRCKPCSVRHLNSDPVMSARRNAGRAAYHAQPAVKAASAARLATYVRTPEARARAVEHGKRCVARLQSPEVRARSNSAEAKAKAGRARTNTVLAWCPPEYRGRYRQLKASQRLLAAEARQLIEEEIAADRRRAETAMSPFERQLARVAAGGRLVEVRPVPSRTYNMTLGGVATGQL